MLNRGRKRPTSIMLYNIIEPSIIPSGHALYTHTNWAH